MHLTKIPLALLLGNSQWPSHFALFLRNTFFSKGLPHRIFLVGFSFLVFPPVLFPSSRHFSTTPASYLVKFVIISGESYFNELISDNDLCSLKAPLVKSLAVDFEGLVFRRLSFHLFVVPTGCNIAIANTVIVLFSFLFLCEQRKGKLTGKIS